MASRFGVTALAAAWALTLLAGCGGEPPPLEDLTAELGEARPQGAAEVAMIFPPRQTPEHGMWESIASARFGQAKMVFSSERCQRDDPPEAQAERVRRAADRGVSALIVIPGDPAALAPALVEARSKGVKVLTLGGAVPVADGPPIPAVTTTPIETAAAEVVAATLKAAAEESPPVEGPALLLVPDYLDDPRIPERVAALKEELTRAGVAIMPDLSYDLDRRPTNKVFPAALEKDPKPALVFGLDDTGTTGAGRVRGEMFDTLSFVVAGYVDNPDMLDVMRTGYCSAIVDGNLTAAGREAVRLTLEQLEGREVPERTEVPTPIRLPNRKPSTGIPKFSGGRPPALLRDPSGGAGSAAP